MISLFEFFYEELPTKSLKILGYDPYASELIEILKDSSLSL